MTQAKRTPKKSTKQKEASEFSKRAAAFRTAVPLLITLLLLGAVYLFVLLPDSPANVLRSAVLNSLDTDKQQSFRYDGSFGDTNRGIKGEYAGQKANNGNIEFRIRLKSEDEEYTSLETINIGDTSYIKLDGFENLNKILSGITGVKKPSDATIATAMSIQGKWIELKAGAKSTVKSAIPCSENLPGFGDAVVAPEMTKDTYPFTLTAGPFTNKDDTEAKLYEAKLISYRTATRPEVALTSFVNCLESSYGEDDFRLHDATKTEQDAWKFTFSVDPLSNTVKRMSMKQVGMYFMINMKDYNKDVAVSVPEGYQTVEQIVSNLTDEQKAQFADLVGKL